MTQRATTGALAAALVVAVGIIGWLLSTTNSPATAILPPRTAELSGDVYMTMKSGDVKRAADIEVVIVPASAELSARWRSMLDAFAVERALLEAAIRTAQA